MLTLQKPKKKSIFVDHFHQLFEQMHCSVAIEEFYLSQVEAYDCLSKNELLMIETSTIQIHQLQKLMVDSLQLSFLYNPLKQCLNLQTQGYIKHYSIKTIIRILFKGQFYRFIHNKQSKLTILINNRTTEANIKIIVASLFIYAARKLSIDQITTCILFFNLEAALNTDPLTIPADSQKIIKVLKKIERVIKSNQYKIWFEAVKKSADFCGQIQVHQFLFLSSLTQKRFMERNNQLVVEPKMSSLFKNLNVNVRTIDFQTEKIDDNPKKTHVRGLTFVEPRTKYSVSLSKQILKQFRLRDPSKYKRPNTAYLRSRIQSVCLLKNIPKPKHIQQNLFQYNKQSKGLKIGGGKLRKATGLNKPQFKLKLR